ncbi:VanZ family protein [Microbacterium sp. NEAU-LLC]|uniref:VanZ family protein n=1 Tax=Microbacterium helvum TaxID=2773713 RepID=A0ABR8NV86_9MICO|nr:VanZ family protein [Microbacterium helvum]MBD3943933.1 VanZ family protein [Microbacterium helvum]
MSEAMIVSSVDGPVPQRAKYARLFLTRSWVTISLLVAYLLVVLAVTLTPSLDTYHVNEVGYRVVDAGRSAGLSMSFGINRLSLIMNVLMFIPLGVLWGLVFERPRWIWIAVAGFPVFSALIECIQGAFLPGRMADAGDIVANSVGGWIGLAIAVVVRNAVQRNAARTSSSRPG